MKALVLHKSTVKVLRQEGVSRVNAQFMSINMRFKGREASVKRLPNRAVEANFERPYCETIHNLGRIHHKRNVV
jgi:hypothetical protein